MTLPFDYSRCVGQTYVKYGSNEQKTPALCDACRECRRREPGHPTRQVYVAPAIDSVGVCDNRIGPAA